MNGEINQRATRTGEKPLACQLEGLWRQGHRPDVDHFLNDLDAVAPAELAAVLGIDQWQRWHAGEHIPAEQYLDRYPVLEADPELALELIYGEFLVREELGETPTVAEFLRRFPCYAAQLQEQLQVHQELERDAKPVDPNAAQTTLDGAVASSPPPARPTLPASLVPCMRGYEVLGKLGQGGMGAVYKARHLRLNRVVALKIVGDSMNANPADLVRFRREAELIARLQHAHIVQIYEVGEYAGGSYLALEYVDGPALDRQVNGTPRPPRETARLVAILARATHYAHGQGIIHRDLKPANVLLTAAGVPKIADFGLARHVELESGLTTAGAIMGTPSYMAPEQAQGQKAVGPLADVYALGAILYECLTGRPPFQGATVLDTLLQVRQRDPVPPHRLLGSNKRACPADLETICLKCLEKDPQRRYASAGALADDLDRYLAGEPIAARPVGPLGRAGRWARRNPGWAAMAGLLVAFAIGMSVLALSLNTSLGRTQQAEHQATNRLFESLLTQVQAGRDGGRPGQRLAGLKSLRQARVIALAQQRSEPDLLRLRNEAIACLALSDLQLEAEWQGNRPGTNGLDFDAAFDRYAWSFRDEGIRVRRLKDHAELFRLPTLPSNCLSRWVRFCFSPNGRYLTAFYQQWTEKHPLEVWDLAEAAGRRVVFLPDVAAPAIFTADSHGLVVALPQGEIAVMELPADQPPRLLKSRGPVEALSLDPKGMQLAVSGGSAEGVCVLDLKSGAVLHRLPHPDVVRGLAWSPDGRLLATACSDTSLYLWDTVSGQRVGECSGHYWSAQDLAFDSTGRWLASFGWDMTLRVWEVASRRQVLRLEDIRVLGFRRQGGLAAAGLTGQGVQVWGFRPSEVLEEMHNSDGHLWISSFGPEGRWLATYAPNGGILRLWDQETYREVTHWPDLGDVLWGPHWAWFLSTGSQGILRTPVRSRASSLQNPLDIQLGQPQPLHGFHQDCRQHTMNWVGSDGRRVVLTDEFGTSRRESRVQCLELDGDSLRLLWETQHLAAVGACPSRDGRLVATFSYEGGNGVRIWEADTGRLVRELLIGDACAVFSSDGRHLYTTTGRMAPQGAECRRWKTESWEPDRAVPLKRTTSSPALLDVAADGTLAVTFTMGDVRLLDPETLKEFATLAAPEPGLRARVLFSPDGNTLGTTAKGTIHLWNLRRLHQELAEMGLDWQGLSKAQAPSKSDR